MKVFKNKTEARNYVNSLGYTVLDEVSSSGDYAHGSREYWAKPDAPKNEFGITKERVDIAKLSASKWVA